MHVDPETAGAIGLTMVRQFPHVRPLLNKFWFLISHGNLSVAVFGSNGVGKSTLGKFLRDGGSYATGQGDYNPSLGIERYALAGDLVCTVLVPPGDERERPYVWNELYQKMSAGKSVGVIHVTSFGYHSFQDLGYNQTSYYQPGQNKQAFMDAYVDLCRKKELAVLRQIKPHLCHAPSKLWMITVVGKQDLWWGRQHEVRDYYECGEYNELIEEIRAERGAGSFTHGYKHASLIMQNFVDGNGELLAPTAEGYDQSIQERYNSRLALCIHDMVQG